MVGAQLDFQIPSMPREVLCRNGIKRCDQNCGHGIHLSAMEEDEARVMMVLGVLGGVVVVVMVVVVD